MYWRNVLLRIICNQLFRLNLTAPFDLPLKISGDRYWWRNSYIPESWVFWKCIVLFWTISTFKTFYKLQSDGNAIYRPVGKKVHFKIWLAILQCLKNAWHFYKKCILLRKTLRNKKKSNTLILITYQSFRNLSSFAFWLHFNSCVFALKIAHNIKDNCFLDRPVQITSFRFMIKSWSQHA